MKKISAIISIILCLSLVLCGCGKKESDTFDYSKPFTDNGMWAGVNAKDCIELCDYASYKVTDEEIEQQITTFQVMYPDTFQVTDRVIEDGDSVNIDYTGYIDGVAFDGGSTGGNGTTVIIGTTQYIDDFLDQLIGHMPGDAFDINVTFPADYGVENLNGRDAVFKTTVNYIVEYDYPEITDEFVSTNLASTYGWYTVAEMRTGIATNLAMNYIYENSPITSVPEAITNYLTEKATYETNMYCDAYEAYAKENNYDTATVLYYFTGSQTREDAVKAALEQVPKQAEYFVLYQALEEDLGMSVDEREVFASYAAVENAAASYEDLQKAYGMPYLMAQVLTDKLTKTIGEMASAK